MPPESPSLLLQRAADKLEQMAAHFKAYEKAQEDDENPFKSATEHWSRLNVFATAHAPAREWMEALSPAVGSLLVAWLREESEDAGRARSYYWPEYEARPSYAFARLVLGLSVEEETTGE